MIIDINVSSHSFFESWSSGGPHFPFLQQLSQQSSLLEHVIFSELCRVFFILTFLNLRHQSGSSESDRTPTKETATKSRHMGTASLFISYGRNSSICFCVRWCFLSVQELKNYWYDAFNSRKYQDCVGISKTALAFQRSLYSIIKKLACGWFIKAKRYN